MSMRKQTPRTRGFRPEADNLEERQLLSAVVSGTDSKGDAWTLRLIGPGALSVVKQNGPDGKPAALNSPTDINTITIGGTDPTVTRLVGTVHKGPMSDGRVFFQELVALPARSVKFSSTGLGMVSVDMPNFWLGNTTPLAGRTTPPNAPNISLPDGVESLRFGGVDTTVNRSAPTSTTTSDVANVTLGLPQYGGTRIVIDKSISSAQTAPSAPTTPNVPGAVIQHGVVFAVAGRLQLFQANEIIGDPLNPPGQFGNENPKASGTGGTTVFSGTAGTPPFFPAANGREFKGGVTGAIAKLRVGGNATNFSVLVNDATNSGNDRIRDFSIGGETQNVLLVAPNGSRHVSFGKGMDTVEIRSHVIDTLKANRGALNSNVYVDRSIDRIELGGDVVNTQVLAGYDQNYGNIFTTITGQSNNPFGGSRPAPPPKPINALPSGGLTAHIAGDVVNSVFAASVEPFNNTFGDPNQLVLTGGHIRGKVEGTVDNAIATPNAPNQAFFAQRVDALSGPVVPPNVPEPPYPGPAQPSHLPGIHHLNSPNPLLAPQVPGPHVPAPHQHHQAQPHVYPHQGGTTPVKPGAATPKGPSAFSNHGRSY
ncbi:MAG: hypothetical protein NVSMB9_28310 [Isosphaeraceae bacterium]